MVHYRQRDGVALLTVDNPPVNALTPGVPEAVQAAVIQANQNPNVSAIGVMGAGRTFMAGADIKELTKPDVGPYIKSLLDCERAIEDSAKPVVMAMHGTAFGGGLEIAMAGHYRIISSTGQAGQPEVKLGLIPGAGGTQRLPRLVGIERALEMCMFGAPVSAEKALGCCLADEIFEGDVERAAVAAALKIAGRKFTKTREKELRADLAALARARERSRLEMPQQTAPLAAVEALAAAAQYSFDEGLKREGELFEQCRRGSQSKALIHLFFAERGASKVPGIAPETNAAADPVQVVEEPLAALNKTSVICLERLGSRLCEIVRGPGASPEAVRAALDHAKKQGRVAVVVGEAVSERLLLRQREMAGAPESRMVQAMAEEGAKILAEGHALRAADIDVISVYACGFPAWRGGVMYASGVVCST